TVRPRWPKRPFARGERHRFASVCGFGYLRWQRRSRCSSRLPASRPTVLTKDVGARGRFPASAERRSSWLFPSRHTKERREMRTPNRTHDVEALREALAARLPARPPGAPQKHDELEERCRAFLQSVRWPGGVECPRCDESERLLWLEARDKWHCYSCRYQF